MSKRPKLQTLKSPLRVLPSIVEGKGIKTLSATRTKRSNPTGRNADPRRALPLNGAAWQKLRAYILRESPLCEHCDLLGLTVAATDVDHIDGDPGNNSMANLQSLCHSCHSHKTMRERHGLTARMGFDINGLPLDPSHHWNRPAEGAQDAPRPIRQRKITSNRER